MRQTLAKKVRQGLRRKDREDAEKELQIIPQLFNPRPRIVPKFLWRLLFYIIVRKEMLKWNE